MQNDLHLTDRQYQICITVTYMYVWDLLWLRWFAEVRPSPYIASELPATLLLRKIGPKTLMPTLLTLWACVVTLQGVQLDHSVVHIIFFLTRVLRACLVLWRFVCSKVFSGPPRGTNVTLYRALLVRILYPPKTLPPVRYRRSSSINTSLTFPVWHLCSPRLG